MSAAVRAVQKIITGLPKATDRTAARRAYEHAEEFFASMAETLIAEDELTETNEDLIDRRYWQQRHEAALDKAAAAASKMPAVWLAILGVEIKPAPVVAAPATAAE